MEAQTVSGRLRGIVAGDPGNNRVRLNVGFLWSWLAINKDPAEALASLKASAPQSGRSRRLRTLWMGWRREIVPEPRRCNFDPAMIQCKGADNETCLTASQVASVRSIYNGARNPRTSARLFSGWIRASGS